MVDPSTNSLSPLGTGINSELESQLTKGIGIGIESEELKVELNVWAMELTVELNVELKVELNFGLILKWKIPFK